MLVLTEVRRKTLVEGIILRLETEDITLTEILDSYVKISVEDKEIIKESVIKESTLKVEVK